MAPEPDDTFRVMVGFSSADTRVHIGDKEITHHLQSVTVSSKAGELSHATFIAMPGHAKLVCELLGKHVDVLPDAPTIPAEWNPTEVLNAFMGWLTTRPTEITLSGHHDAATPAGLIRDFAERHHLPAVRDGWEKLIIPEERDERV